MRKYIILLITILLIGGNKLSAQENQKKDSEQFDTSKNTIIDLKNKRVYQNILLDKDYSFPLNPFPDTLIISYTGNDYLKRRIIFFNKGKKDSLIISWAGTGSNIENLKLSDFNQGKVALSFAGKALINIGNREKPIKPRSFLNWNTWIMVEPLPAKDDADNKTSDTFCKDSPVIQWVKPVDSAKLAKAIVCILCNSFPKCNETQKTNTF